MVIKNPRRTKIITLLLLLNVLFSFGMTFAYWASQVNGNNNNSNGAVILGQWYDGIPIYTVDEFVQMVTTDNNTGNYVLAKNLNFNNTLPAEWTGANLARFRGTFNGLGHTISNLPLNAHRGIFGVLEGATIQNLVLNNINNQFTSTDGLLSSGILVGRIQGTNNLIENIQINNSQSVNTNVLTGSIVGLVQPEVAPGVSDPLDQTIIRNITINNVTLSGGLANQTYGNGGIVGTLNNHEILIEDVYFNGTVTSPAAHNSGGIIGATLNRANATINNATVENSIIQINGSNTTLGAGGIIGKTTPTGAITLNNTSVLGTDILMDTTSSAGGVGGTIGYLQGTSHSFTNTTVSNSTVYSRTTTGGVVGLFVQSSGTLSLDQTVVEDVSVSTTLASNTFGVGGVIGTMDNVNVGLTNTYVKANVLATGALNAGGIIGSTLNTSNPTINNATIENSTIQINGNNTNLGAGGIIGKTTPSGTVNITNGFVLSTNVLMDTGSSSGGVGGMIGYMQGTSHQFNFIRVLNSNILSRTSTGGLTGLQTGSSSNSTYNNIKVQGSTITSNVSDTNIGVGGVIGQTVSFSSTLNDIYVEATVQGTSLQAGGVIGYVQSGATNTINRAVVYSTIQLTNSTSTARGAAGIIGRNSGTQAGNIANHTFFSGYLRSHVATNRPYAGILRGVNTNLTFTNSRSAEIRYWESGSNTNQLINEANNTLYNRLRGQKANFSIAVYRQSRNSLDVNYWLTNYSTFDYDGNPANTTSLWFYNSSNILELRG